jgi:hypothetical protein
MKENKDIESKNSKGEYHGYQEWCWGNGEIKCRGMAKNDKELGYFESHNYNNSRINYKTTRFFIR